MSSSETIRLKYLATVEMGQSPPSSEYSLLPEIGLPFLQGTADFGTKYPEPKVYCATPTKTAIPDDILFSVRAPVGELNIADRELGIGRGLCAIRCQQNLDRKYTWWALHWVRQQLSYVATGSTYEAVAVDDVANMFLPFYPLPKQRAIADYLDRETTRLDSLIAAKERLLELLAEKRRAVITHAVTRGLNHDVSLKSSGVEWLGKVPSHWEIEYARWLFNDIDERSTEHNEEELLSVSHITGVTKRAEKEVNMFTADSNEGYKICRQGDLVINTLWAWMGAMGIAFQDGIVSPAYNVYRLREKYIPEYIELLVRMPVFAQEVIRYSKGVWSSRLRLYPEEFFKVQMPVPPIAEQKEIVAFLKDRIEKIDRLAVLASKTIEHLHERRASLIAAAVSGQIRVV